MAVLVLGGLVTYISLGSRQPAHNIPSDIISKDSLDLIKEVDSLTVILQQINEELAKYENNHTWEDASSLSMDNFEKEDKLLDYRDEITCGIKANKYMLENYPTLRQITGISVGDSVDATKKEMCLELIGKYIAYGYLSNFKERKIRSEENFAELKRIFNSYSDLIDNRNIKYLSHEQCEREKIEIKNMYLAFLTSNINNFHYWELLSWVSEEIKFVKEDLAKYE